MKRQHIVDELKKQGYSHPFRNIKIWTGKALSIMTSYYEAASLRGYQVQPENYYVFICDKGNIFEYQSAESAADSALDNGAFEYNTVNVGDLVDFGQYGRFYICGENISGTKFLVTAKPAQNHNGPEETFYIEKDYATNILENKCC